MVQGNETLEKITKVTTLKSMNHKNSMNSLFVLLMVIGFSPSLAGFKSFIKGSQLQVINILQKK